MTLSDRSFFFFSRQFSESFQCECPITAYKLCVRLWLGKGKATKPRSALFCAPSKGESPRLNLSSVAFLSQSQRPKKKEKEKKEKKSITSKDLGTPSLPVKRHFLSAWRLRLRHFPVSPRIAGSVLKHPQSPALSW